MGMVLHKILDKALSSRHKWIKSIEGFKKKLKFQYKYSKSLTLTLKSYMGLGIAVHKILDQHLSPC